MVATTVAGTRQAIAAAAALAVPYAAQVHVIAPRSLEPEWPLDRQAARLQAFTREIRRLAEGMRAPIDVLPCVCRRLTDVTQLLPRGATVVIAGPSRRWWPSREQRLAHDLTGLGHHVMFIHTSAEAPSAVAG